MNELEIGVVERFNGMAGSWQPMDNAALVLGSDYLLPVMFSLALLATWFAGRNLAERGAMQVTVMVGVAALGISNALVALGNWLVPRQRPFDEFPDRVELIYYASTDPSFPANPVVVGFSVGAALWPSSRRLGAVVCAGGFLIGVARVYSGLFYPTDVLGGAVVGIIAALLLHRARRFLEPIPAALVRVARVFVLGIR